MGCASIHVGDDPGAAAMLCRDSSRPCSPPDGEPSRAIRSTSARPSVGERIPMPTLLRGYLRMGAYVCGEPAWDERLSHRRPSRPPAMARLNERYAQRLLRAA